MARPGLIQHRKFHRLVRALGGSKMLAVGALELLWLPCYETGNDYLGTSEDVENSTGWAGDPGVLTRALLDAGFIDAIDDVRFRVHDLLEHAPEYVATRRAREEERRRVKTCEHCGATYHSSDRRSRYHSHACRQAAYRQSLRTVTDTSVTVTDRDSTPAPAPPYVRTSEDVRTSQQQASLKDSDCSETPKRRSLPAVTEPALLEFPVDGAKSKGKHAHRTVWPLTQPQLTEWVETYQTLDVFDECRRALAWVKANPSRRKTYDGMPAFLNNWLSRGVNMRRTGATVITGSLKTAGNKAALEAILKRHTDVLDE